MEESRVASYRLDSLTRQDAPPPSTPYEKNWMKIILVFIFILIAILTAYYVFAGQESQSTSKPNSEASTSSTLEQSANSAKLVGIKEGYLKLDSVLYQLTQTKDYQDFGQRYELDISGGDVTVEIEINDAQFILPKAFGTEARRNGKFITALVPIDRLIQLAEDHRILAIRKPEK